VGAQGEASAAREEEVSSLQALLSSEREKMASLEQEFTSCVVERDGRFSDLEGKLSEYKIRNSKALEKLKETISSLKEKSDEVCSLQERMTEIERLYGSRCEEFNSLSASYEEVSSQLQGSAEEVSALRHQVSVLQYAQDQWEHQCEDLRTLVKDNEKEKSEQAIILQSKLDSLKKRYEETPWRFTIVLRVRDKGLQNVLEDSQPGSTWCLLQRRDSVDSEPYYQWQEDATVIAWFKELCAQQILQKKVAASEENAKEALEADEKETEVSSFSISGNDEEEDDEEKDHGHDICGDLTKDGEGNLVLPDTLQDVSNCRLEIMKRDLQNQIEVLRGEVETNRIAFDRYRDRAKDTLRASIADQKELENKLAVYKEEVKQDLQGKEKLEKRSRMLEMQLEEQQRDYENKLQMEHQKWVDIAENLGRLEDENMKLQHLLTSLQNQQSQSSSHSEELEALKATHNEEMTAVADELHIIREKESQLEKEMKKRGDAARQMLTEKDKDIEQLRKSLSTLQQELKQLQQQPLIVPAAPASAQVDATVSSGGKRGGLQWSDNSADPGASYKLDDILSTEEKRIFDDIHHQESNASQNSKLFEEVYRRARLRETELLDIIKMLKNEVNSMRKRFSLIRAERQQFNSSSSTNLMNSSFSQQQHHQHHLLLTPRKTTGTPSTTKTPDDSVNTDPQTMTAHDLEFEGDVPVNRYVEDDNHWAEIEDSVRYDPEQEARLVYLKQAFSGFFRAKNPVEMQHLGRVICAILGVDIEEQGMIMEGITKLSPAVVATTTIDSITQQIASIFS
jgi:DNA repair exonuclease SbcCD ATPase subunit